MEEVLVEHRLPIDKLEFWKKRDDGYRDAVKPEKGEVWSIGLSEGGLGTFWRRWGSLDEDLKGKEFRKDAWFDGEKDNGEKEEESTNWVYTEGDNGSGLNMQIQNQAMVTFV